MVCLTTTSLFATVKSTVEKDYNARFKNGAFSEITKEVKRIATDEAQLTALKFLYAYMPTPDMTDYSPAFYKMNAEYALRTREQMPWGKLVPEREFYHFVLPVRINNENLDESRKVFFDELKDRVAGMTMLEAALEVNHWCHEKVTYHPSDSRTSAPLATVKSAYGRCGEESTFGVAAMRAVGIPARQVYTPRWAHTDDNHAWVEVWIDGKWQFLGACEPEPVLNLGWFNAPASRGILMHTKVFGHYEGPEDVMSKNYCFTEINVTDNYAPTATTTVRTVATNGKPVAARVEFKVYNYGEMFTVCQKRTGKNGTTYIKGGLGDIIVWASAGGKWGIAKCSIGKDKTVTVTLDKDSSYQGQLDFDLVPPVERNTIPELTKEQVDENQKRFVKEDSIRNAYVATFFTADKARLLALAWDLPANRVEKLFIAARGNHATIFRFLKDACDKNRALRLLETLTEKDIRDVSLCVLNDHYTATPRLIADNEAYYQYVMCPRVDNEMIEPYKAQLQEALQTLIPADKTLEPQPLINWIKQNITVIDSWNPQNLRQRPTQVLKYRVADQQSRDMFFVAAARSLGIYARKDAVTGKAQWSDNGSDWVDVNFAESAISANSEQGTISADYTPTGRLDDPKYYYHFTISKLEDNLPVLLNYPEVGYNEILKKGSKLDTGHYVLTSGTRLSNGSVLAQLNFINISKEADTHTTLTMRSNDDKVQVIGQFNSENTYYDLATKSTKSLLSSTGRGYYIIALINPNHEPTNHALNDIAQYSADFEQWGQKIVLLFADQDAAKRHKTNEIKQLPNTVIYGTDINGAIAQEIRRELNLTSNERPIFLIADTFNRVVFYSQGYTISLGEQIMKVIHQLK